MPGDADRDLVEAFLAAYRDHSNRAAANAAGVSEATVRRWRDGRVATPLQTRTRLRLRECVGRSAAGTNGAGGIAETDGIAGTTGPPAVAGSAGAATGLAGAAQATAPSPPMELFGSPARVIRYIGSIAPPGRERARKRYALEGIRHVITAWEPLPTWWYELREKFESGEV